jgi:rRNA-processing protein FCF1
LAWEPLSSSVKVILDTNALMTPEQFGVDIFSELQRLGFVECLVPRPVLRELKSLTTRADKGRDKTAARVGLGLARQCKIMDTSVEDADRAIEELAISENASVFTNDQILKKRLFSKGITVIYLRQGRYLEAAKKEY